MGVRKYDFEPCMDKNNQYQNQQGHSDYNNYKLYKDRERYEGYGGTRTNKLIFDYNKDYNPNAPTITIGDGEDGDKEQINVDVFDRYSDGSVDEIKDKKQTHVRGESEGPGIFSGTDDYDRTERDITNTYLQSTQSADEIRTLAFTQLEELKDNETVTAEEAQSVISNVIASNKVTPDFQEYLDTEGAAEGSEIAQCQEEYNTAKDSYKEAHTEWANIASGNDPELKQLKAEAQQRRDNYYALLDKKKDEVGTLADDIKFVDQEADQSMEKIQEYNSAIVENNNQINEVWEQKKNVEAEQIGIQNKLNSITSKITTLDTTIQGERNQLTTIEKQIDGAEDEAVKTSLKSQKNKLNSQIQKQEEQKKALETEQAQWQTQLDEANQKIEALETAYNVLIEEKEDLENQRKIEYENYEKIHTEQENLHNELNELIANWTEQEQKIVSDYYDNLNAYKEKYDEKTDLAVNKLNSAIDVKDNALEALTQAKANAYDKFLEWKEQKRIEEEQRAQEEAAAAAQSAGGTDATGGAAAADTASTDAAAATSTGSAAGTSTASSSSAAQTQSARQEQVQQVQSSQQLSNAQSSADRVLSSASKDLDDLFDGNVNSLKRISSDKAAAYDGFIGKLETLNSSVAKAISDKKAELDDVDSDYREVRRDIIKLETSMSAKETYLSIANTELESLKDAQSGLNNVDTSGLNDSQKETLKELKTDVAKAIQKKEEEIDRLSDAENSLNTLRAKESELKEQRTKLRGELKEMMADAADLYSSNAPDLKSYSGSYNKLVNDYDREESAKETEVKTSLKDESDNIDKYKDDKLAEAKKYGDKYKFDPDA